MAARLLTLVRTDRPRKTYADPVEYAREVLGIEAWKKQAEILRAPLKHDRVAVKSGHKVSKSCSLCILALWWVHDPETRPNARVVMTSSSGRQVRAILWKEMRRLYRRASRLGRPIGGVIHKRPDGGLQFDDGREIIGFATNEPEKMAGYSGENLLFILDEASGIGEEIFEAIEGNRAGGAKLVMCSNPTQTVGEFYEAFDAKSNFYYRIEISSEESPNVTGIGTPIPGLATKAWIAEKKAEWGEDDPRYQVRVKGNFPTQSEFAVIGMGLVDAGQERGRAANDDQTIADKLEGGDRLELGVDPARFGSDATKVCARRGLRCLAVKKMPRGDGIDTAGAILDWARELRRDEDEIPLVKVDSIGIGAGIFDALSRENEIEVVEIDVRKKPAQPDEYVKLRDELWFTGRKWLKDGGALPDDGELRGDLMAPDYGFDAQGRARVEEKKVTKLKLKRSPDAGDAFCMAVYTPPPAAYDSVKARSRR